MGTLDSSGASIELWIVVLTRVYIKKKKKFYPFSFSLNFLTLSRVLHSHKCTRNNRSFDQLKKIKENKKAMRASKFPHPARMQFPLLWNREL